MSMTFVTFLLLLRNCFVLCKFEHVNGRHVGKPVFDHTSLVSPRSFVMSFMLSQGYFAYSSVLDLPIS